MTEYIVALDESKINENQFVWATRLIHCNECRNRTHNGTCLRSMKKKPDDGYCDEAERKE